MGLFDKLKNVFIEEEEEDIPQTIVKQEEKKVEIKEVKPEIPVNKSVPVSDNTFSDRELLDTGEKFKFPIIFKKDMFFLAWSCSYILRRRGSIT